VQESVSLFLNFTVRCHFAREALCRRFSGQESIAKS